MLSLNLFNQYINDCVFGWPFDKLEAYIERISIMEYHGNIPRVRAEEEAFLLYADFMEKVGLVKYKHARGFATSSPKETDALFYITRNSESEVANANKSK